MAAPVVTNTNNRRTAADATTGFSSDGGGGAGPGVEPDFVFQGSAAVSRKVSSGGFQFADGTAQDMTVAGDEVVMLKCNWTNYSVLNLEGAKVRVGSASSAYREFIVADSGQRGDIDYPIQGGWLIVPVDPNVVEWGDSITGSPTITAVDYYSIQGDFSASSKSENVIIDAIDLSPGLFQVDGIGTGDGFGARWERFENHDAQTIANRFGHILLVGGSYQLYGKFVIGRNASGTVTATKWDDSNQTVVFQGGRVDVGWNGIEVDLGNASTVVTFTNCVHKGLGRRPERFIFAANKDVNSADDDIVLAADGQGGEDWQSNGGNPGNGSVIGWALSYTRLQGGVANIGLTPGTVYYAAAGQNNGLLGITTSRADAYDGAGTGLVNLTVAGSDEEHQLTLGPCNLPVLEVTGTSGTFTSELSTYEQFNTMTLNASCTFNNSTFINCWRITATGTVFSGCTFENQYMVRGEQQMVHSDPGQISDCTFIASPVGPNHAIQCNNAGTYSFTNNVFEGFGPEQDDFNGITDVLSTTPRTIRTTENKWSTGDAVAYNDNGNLTLGSLSDGRIYYVNARTTTSVSLHRTKADAVDDTNAIAFTANSGTHTLHSAGAAFVNSSGGTITLNVSGGSGLSVRNGVGSTTIVNNTVNVTLTGLVNPTEVRVYANDSTTELAGQEDVTTGSYLFSLDAGTVVDIRIFSVNYLPADILDFTIPSSATSIPVQQIFDRNFSNPD